uniref:DNA N(6)-methyladenine demethylase n=1 Tax=Rhizophora mucronata TaxID=61149 RepID=A0A2P2QLL5_RHIMU
MKNHGRHQSRGDGSSSRRPRATFHSSPRNLLIQSDDGPFSDSTEESISRERYELSHQRHFSHNNANDTSGKNECQQMPLQSGSVSGANEQASFPERHQKKGNNSLENQVAKIEPFDICPQPSKTRTPVMLKPSLLVKNREKRNEFKRATEESNAVILRPGMVLLKGYLSILDQIKIVKLCRDLGLGSGGFYQPGYRDGARLHLKMMCLGRNWDPETSQYGEYRSVDGAMPPSIPNEFCRLVEKAIKDSQALIERNSKASNVEDNLPWMSPNLCIVNFYSASGKLGLHQDKNESQESLQKGLPVVSFSIGDSGEFLYGDCRDVEKAKKVVLDSGDVLIFGGTSRLVFHGVASILPNTAPKAMLDKTNLRPGRLNLTFREY